MTMPPSPPIDETLEDDAEPAVANAPSGRGGALVFAGFALAAVLLFVVLNNHRMRQAEPAAQATTGGVQPAVWSPPPLEIEPQPIATGPGAPFSGLPTQVMPTPVAVIDNRPPTPSVITTGPVPIGSGNLDQRRRAPSVVVDLGGGQREAGAAISGATIGAPVADGGGAQRPQLNDSEQFAKRVGDEAPDRARAVTLRNLDAIAPQGTVIPGVLETAINSDLPGFTRAIVSRDVLSFDGKAVLIPRSSRLIGQYKSGVALGQSRAFIIWTRIIRPDGVSIQIGSPGTDALGRGGLTGDVNRHFFRRFSGSILLSVLNAGVAAIGTTPSTQISIGNATTAAGLASSAMQGDAIPPTIKVAQGEIINIFVARDLDFSGVAPVR